MIADPEFSQTHPEELGDDNLAFRRNTRAIQVGSCEK